MRKVGGVVCRNPGLALANTSNLEALPFPSVVMGGIQIGLPSTNSWTVLEPVQTSPPGDVYAAPKLKRSAIASRHSPMRALVCGSGETNVGISNHPLRKAKRKTPMACRP